MDRDEQIAAAIRNKIASEELDRQRCGYEKGNPNDAYIQGRIAGLRLALAFVSPNPHE